MLLTCSLGFVSFLAATLTYELSSEDTKTGGRLGLLAHRFLTFFFFLDGVDKVQCLAEFCTSLGSAVMSCS